MYLLDSMEFIEENLTKSNNSIIEEISNLQKNHGKIILDCRIINPNHFGFIKKNDLNLQI